VKIKADLPVDFIEVEEVWVRGELGPLTVWHTPDGWRGKHDDKDSWTCVYEQTHRPSWSDLTCLKLQRRIRLRPGESCGLYVHSKLPNDEALVYDNGESGPSPTVAPSPRAKPSRRSRYPHAVRQPTHEAPPLTPSQERRKITHQDKYVQVLPGLAHLQNEPFSSMHPWGAWRDRRCFVGRLSYGVRYLLWNPPVHFDFPPEFQELVVHMFLMQRRDDSVIAKLPDDCIMYIMNMCRFDWVEGAKARAKGDRARLSNGALGSLTRGLANALRGSWKKGFLLG